MQNLNSQEQVDWQRRCARQRDLARTSPCFHPGQALMECYGFALGPWNCRLTLDRFFNPPSWHGTVSLFKEIGDEAVTDAEGRHIFDVPQDALLAVNSWTKEDLDIAKDVLGEMFGPLIHGEHQQVVVMKGIFALHWATSEKEAGTLDS